MTKAQIINEIAESTGVQKKDVAVVVESFMESIKNSMLNRKENVYLRGFGSFIIKHRAAKIIHWQNTNAFVFQSLVQMPDIIDHFFLG